VTADAQSLATFAATLPLLLVAHNLADHVTGQTHAQALTKAAPGATGWLANLRHVAAYHATLIALTALAWWLLPLHITVLGALLATVWSAGTHALLDRRWPVRWILVHTRKQGFADLNSGGVSGMYLADQALHHGALLVSALMLAAIR
jgi:hypothetical protein